MGSSPTELADGQAGSGKAPDALTIFIIEDSPLLRDMLIERLQGIATVKVVGHASGESLALKYLEGKGADLAILDIELAQGSGVGILRAIRKDPKRYKVCTTVVLTNYAHESVRRRCMELGCTAFFDKSIQIDALVSLVQRLSPPPAAAQTPATA